MREGGVTGEEWGGAGQGCRPGRPRGGGAVVLLYVGAESPCSKALRLLS